MVSQAELTLIMLVLIAVPSSHGQFTLITNEDTPSLLDRVLQVVWEPSSLIRMWVGLDQLYNIALSWKGVAKKLASLPFDKGRSMDHVTIQEPRSFKYRKPSVSSQWDRFNKIYSSSNLSPIVADMRNRLSYAYPPKKPPRNNLQTAEDYTHKIVQMNPNAIQVNPNAVQLDPNSVLFGLPLIPPSFLYNALDEFVDPDLLIPEGHSAPFGNSLHTVAGLDMQRRNQKILQNKRFSNQFGDAESPVSQGGSDSTGLLNGGPSKRLDMFLKLLKTLGDIHSNEIRRESSDDSDH